MPESTFAFEALGTQWEIVTDEPLDPELRHRILERVDLFDRAYSRFRADSLVTRLARAERGDRVEFPPDAVELFGLYDVLFAATDGAVDPLVGRDLELLGYAADYSLTPAPERDRPVDRARWTADVSRQGRTVVTRRPVVIDVGAVGKGFLVDRICELLRSAGIARTVVDGSGDLRVAGDQVVRVGLEHPTAPGRVVGVADVRDRALCASAVNRRAWGEGLHHVVDGRDGRPTHTVLATWVVADTAAVADGLATALFFSEPADLAVAFEFTFVRMFAGGGLEWSADFGGEVFAAGADDS